MSLKHKFKIDAIAANEGVWVEFSDCPNKDGSIPSFLLARASKQNTRYQLELHKVNKQIGVDRRGMLDMASITEDKAEAMELDMFLGTILLNWSNFQPEDDGVELDFSRENARMIFSSRDWLDLYDELNLKALTAATFRDKQVEAEAKN
jgi:hypothetical protein